MTNVVPIGTASPKEPPPVDTLRMLQMLRKLHFASFINTDALWLGTQVLQRMAEHKTDTVAITPRQAMNTYVVARGNIIAGQPSKSPEAFTIALQELHYHAGIRSALTSDCFNVPGMELCHFTQDASIMSPAFSQGTPIHFACDPAALSVLEGVAQMYLDDTMEQGQRVDFNPNV